MVAITTAADGSIEVADFRQIFGLLPTGVVAITGKSESGKPLGFVVGTFQSLSLDPPLVMFAVDKGSSTWPWIRNLEQFTANILSTEQLSVCKALARKGDDKFKDLPFDWSSIGTPRLPNSTAWIDCDVASEIVAGDHYVIVGEIKEMEQASDDEALLFRGGKFGEFDIWDRPAPEPKPIAEEVETHE
ncbi:flavin reductase family protein [Brevibacterium sp. UCMA 11754]|uniref:flavin reductase family protein n=1 Tax=Brevibacterium sp. UCMA 11754 TaxID=2749198 RepID=UPI001F300182|nr:flavin reductase family protein [Brevibacterium sp. UCMA 11754]